MTEGARNIAEYVAKYVIKANQYRDEEIKTLENVLEEFEIIKCNKCLEYVKNFDSCEMCEYKCCLTCSTVKHYSSWNLSGMDMCEKCSVIYCHWCLLQVNTKDKTCLNCKDL
jgi:hypothetical protein